MNDMGLRVRVRLATWHHVLSITPPTLPPFLSSTTEVKRNLRFAHSVVQRKREWKKKEKELCIKLIRYFSMHAWVILSATCFNLTSETGAGLLSVRWSPTVREHELHDVLELQHQLARHLIVSVLKTAARVACCRDYPLPVMPPDPPPCRAPAHPRLPSIRVRLQELSPSWGLKSRQANAFLWETPERLLSSLLPATPAW